MIDIWLFIAFGAGVFIGIHYANRTWRDNADALQRKESGTHHYKVIYAESQIYFQQIEPLLRQLQDEVIIEHDTLQ